MDDELVAEQRRITRIALETLGSDDFALAGSGAIREHGLIDRPTQDVDLFTVQSALERFDPAVDRLERADYRVETLRRQVGFAQFEVASSTDVQIGMDLGIDWRAEPAACTATRTSTAWPSDPMVDSPLTTSPSDSTASRRSCPPRSSTTA